MIYIHSHTLSLCLSPFVCNRYLAVMGPLGVGLRDRVPRGDQYGDRKEDYAKAVEREVPGAFGEFIQIAG